VSVRHVQTIALWLFQKPSNATEQETNSCYLVKKFPAFGGTVFTRIRHLSISWASSIQSTTSHLAIVILPYHLRLCLPSDLFLIGFPTKILFALNIVPARATCSAHLILLGEAYTLRNSSICDLINLSLPKYRATFLYWLAAGLPWPHHQDKTISPSLHCSHITFT
jgi:hypothetical protein